jgi:UDP:flavonoid glycosyltransferase YjiC (YdhE family)
MHLSIIAVGSRGDIQPYLALCLGLQKAGLEVQFCADRLFEKLVTSTGLPFTPVTALQILLQPHRKTMPFCILHWHSRDIMWRKNMAFQPWGSIMFLLRS